MAVVISLRPGQLAATLRASASSNKDAVRRGIRNGAERGAAYMGSNNGPTPVDEGMLKGAWQAKHSAEGSKIVNVAPYVGIVERGARPHMPPLEPILGWVKRHFAGTDEREILRIAEAIRHRIARYGQKATWFVRDSLPVLSDLLTSEMADSLSRALSGKP